MDDARFANSLRAWGDRVAKKAREYRQIAVGEGQLTDLAGEMRSIENRLAADRRIISSEFDPGGTTAGRGWAAKTTKVGQQSFNAPAILMSAQSNGLTLMDLVNAGALKLDWKMMKLKDLFAKHDIEFRQVGHEIESGDPMGPHLGLWYKAGSTSYEAVE